MSRGTDLFYHFMRYCRCYPVGRAYFRISGAGREHLPGQGPYILAANHQSLVDPWFLGRYVGRPANWMAKRRYCEKPLWRRWFCRACGTIPVEIGRLDHTSARKALEVLRAGGVIGTSPRGIGPGRERSRRAIQAWPSSPPSRAFPSCRPPSTVRTSRCPAERPSRSRAGYASDSARRWRSGPGPGSGATRRGSSRSPAT